MTSCTYSDSPEFKVDYMTVLKSVFSDVEYLEDKNYKISRVKIEARLTEDMNLPVLYTEAHLKLVVDSIPDSIPGLDNFDARLSRNMFDEKHRFLNMRRRDISGIKDATEALGNLLTQHKVVIAKKILEAVLLDTNPHIDKGWIDAPTGNR